MREVESVSSGMSRPGPKGAWKFKGPVFEKLTKLFEENASAASWKMAERVYKMTGVRVSSSRIREYRR